MKIQCSVCEAAEATILCCADEASLCWTCDQKVHSANKLLSKHQRVRLSTSSSQMPKCDICQETLGYFFCLEDRSLLCRRCDVSIHTANALVSKHQRFLLTGVKVGLEATMPDPSPSSEKTSGLGPQPLQKGTTSSQDRRNPCSQGQAGIVDDLSLSMLQINSSIEASSPCQLDQYAGFGDISENCTFMYDNSLEVHNGYSNCSTVGNDSVSSTLWDVQQYPSDEAHRNPSETAVSVPDIRNSHWDNFTHHHQSNASSMKRKRQ